MSLRNMDVQYVGDTLYLPPFEREVKHIVVKDWEHFEKERTCRIEMDEFGCYPCSACGVDIPSMFVDRIDYCPYCGAKVVD